MTTTPPASATVTRATTRSRTTRASPSRTRAAPCGNTNNLNGKILRIHPEADGTYTLPEGNLFTGKETAEGGGKTRGEIYVMGVRNPARISVDRKTDTLYAGWVGPDAGEPSTTWGPAKYDTFAVITKASNRGWPYCMGNKQPYRDRNLPDPTKPLGWYDCDHPKNESPNNDGLVNLPPVTGNNIWYSPQGGAPDYPRDANGIPSYKKEEAKYLLPWLKGGGQAAMDGPVYRYDASVPNTDKWPSYWDGKWFVGDFYDATQPRHAVITDPKTATTAASRCTPRTSRRSCRSATTASRTSWTGSSAPTARSTSSTTAAASSPRTPSRPCGR